MIGFRLPAAIIAVSVALLVSLSCGGDESTNAGTPSPPAATPTVTPTSEIAPAATPTSVPTVSPTEEIALKVDEFINAYLELGKFSGAVLIAKDGEVLLSRGYGMANYEHDVPNTPRTKFRLASITKSFTALATLQLQEMGLLDVDEPIATYLPDYLNGDQITIHHLLTHTSGIPSYNIYPEYWDNRMLPSAIERTVGIFKDKPLEFSPGERYQYSNSGFLLLGHIIEEVSGETWETFVRENIFQPLKMFDTGYFRHGEVLKNRAAGYYVSGVINADYIDPSWVHGAGGLYSTVEDLYLYDRALYTEELVSRDLLEKMFTPHASVFPPSTDIGYAWVIERF